MASDLSLKRRVIRMLEKARAQPVLAKLGTSVARKLTQADVELLYDGIWIRRIGDVFFGDKLTFDYYVDEFRAWNRQHDIWLNDPADFWFYAYRPVPGDTVVDIGAGFGNDAVTFSRAVGDTGRVLAVEAHPVSAQRLAKTIEWTQLKNVTPLAIAVGDSEGSVFITGESDDVANSTVTAEGQEEGYDVPLRRLDDVLDDQGTDEISLLKMNIEGAETAALTGMPAGLKRTRHVVISCHDFRSERGESEYFRTKADVAEILEQSGFELSVRPDDPRPYVRDMLYGVRS